MVFFYFLYIFVYLSFFFSFEWCKCENVDWLFFVWIKDNVFVSFLEWKEKKTGPIFFITSNAMWSKWIWKKNPFMISHIVNYNKFIVCNPFWLWKRIKIIRCNEIDAWLRMKIKGFFFHFKSFYRMYIC